MSRRARITRGSEWRSWLLLAALAVAVAGVVIAVVMKEQDAARQETESRLDRAETAAHEVIHPAIDAADDLAVLFSVGNRIGPAAFERFGRAALAGSDLLSVTWAPRVALQDRPAFERATGRPITDRRPGEDPVLAAARPVYYPTRLAWPPAAGGDYLGIDLLTSVVSPSVLSSPGTRIRVFPLDEARSAVAFLRPATSPSGQGPAGQALVVLPSAAVAQAVSESLPGVPASVGAVGGGWDLRGVGEDPATRIVEIEEVPFVVAVERADAGLLVPVLACLVALTILGLATTAVVMMTRRRRERDRASADRAREAARLRALLEAIPDVELRVGPDDRIVAVKDGILSGVGEVSDLLGSPIDALAPPVGPALTGAVRRARAEGSAEGAVVTPDGRHLETRCVRAREEVIVLVRDVTEQRVAAMELRESERRYRLLAENPADALLVLDADRVIGFASPATHELLGWPPDHLRGRRISDLIDPRDLSAIEGVCARAFADGVERVRTPDHRIVRRDGTPFWAESTARLLRGPDGAVVEVHLSIRDVTARRRAERSLRLSEERFRLIAENAADAIITADASGVIRFASPSADDVVGWTPAQLVGRRYADLIDERDAASVIAVRDEALADGAPSFRTPQHRLVGPGGRRVWVEAVARLSRHADGRLREFQASIRDVSSRRAAEEAVRASEARFRLIAENTGDIVLRSSTDARITYASPAVRELLGWTPDQLVGREIPALLHPDDWPAIFGQVEAAITSGDRQTRLPDHRMRRRDGAVVWVETTCRVLRDTAGRPEGVVSTVRAVGDRRRAEAALRRQTAETDRLAAEQGALRRVATAVAEQRPADEIEGICAEEAGRLLSGSAACVVRFRGEFPVVQGAWSAADGARPPATGQTLAAGSLCELARTGTAMRLAGAWRLADGGDGDLVAAPVRVSGLIWGAIVVATLPGAGDASDPARLQEFAELLEASIENAESRAALALRADRDSLTGLLNHRAFHERLASEVGAARSAGGDLAVALVDIDNFRAVNEVHGHQRGDEVIAKVGMVMASTAREGDHVARIGGEEFAWVMPGASVDDGVLAAERLTRALREVPVPGVGAVSVSVGVCDLRSAETSEDLVRFADGALYWAKANGRSQVVSYAQDTVRELSVHDRAERLERERALYGIRALARAVDARDSATHRHSERVAAITVRLAERMGADRDLCRRLHAAALVHDVGKIGIPDAVLLKPSRLTEEEYALVKRHPGLGAEIVQEVLAPDEVEWVRSHHERWDGSGYPVGLAGTEIPWGARLMAVADSWDVMTADRPYREALDVLEAVAELRRCSGTQFDPEVVVAMLEMVAEERLGASGPGLPEDARRREPAAG